MRCRHSRTLHGDGDLKVYFLDTTFKHNDRDFDPEEMFSLDYAVDFDGAFESFVTDFGDFNVDSFHACFTDV